MAELTDIQSSTTCKVGRLLLYTTFSPTQLPFMLAQVCFETGWFSNTGAIAYNNYSGIKYTDSGLQLNSTPSPVMSPEGDPYAVFNTAKDWAIEYVRIISKGTNEPLQATNLTDYVNDLKANGYFTADTTTYLNGLQSILDNNISGLMPQIYGVAVSWVLGIAVTFIGVGWMLYRL